MEKFDKEAISDGYEISFVLKEVAKIKNEIANVKKELKPFEIKEIKKAQSLNFEIMLFYIKMKKLYKTMNLIAF